MRIKIALDTNTDSDISRFYWRLATIIFPIAAFILFWDLVFFIHDSGDYPLGYDGGGWAYQNRRNYIISGCWALFILIALFYFPLYSRIRTLSVIFRMAVVLIWVGGGIEAGLFLLSVSGVIPEWVGHDDTWLAIGLRLLLLPLNPFSVFDRPLSGFFDGLF